jgi:HAD superfamily hydrolase (TIGR01509 family)
MRREALARALADEGLSPDARTLDTVAALPTRAAAATAVARARRGGDDTAVELATLRAERHFAALIGKGVSLAPGARELLGAAAGVARLGLVTRASRREVEFVLALAGLDGAFECIVAAEDVASPKPSPEGYRRALERLARRRAAPPAGALALEDAAAGVRAARAAGVACVAVGPFAAYEALEADAAVPSLAGHSLSTLAALVLPAAGGEAHAR